MKKVLHPRISKAALGASICAALAACGGGGSSAAGGANNPPPTSNTQITGKVLDGYLNGAEVCFDNGQGACDSTLPTTTTDANGNYTLPSDPSYLGKTLIAVVTPQTTDASRPAGFTFPASFTLSQTVTASAGTENITPLTSLVTAQMQTGLSQGQATAAVSQMLNGVDPNADYVAAGDSTTLTTAQTIVNTLTSFATNGTVDAATNRNTLNAMVAANSPTVTSAQVQAQASAPVFGSINAAQVLSQPTYALEGYLPYFTSWTNGTYTQAIVQDLLQLSSGQLSTSQQEYDSGAWQPVTNGKYELLQGVYEMKSDGTWSGFVPVATYRAPLPVSINGAVLSGTDATTGISYTYEFRQADLSNQPLATAVPASWNPFVNLWQVPSMTSTTFSSGTQAYLGLLSYNADQVILPVWTWPCDAPTLANGQACGQPAEQEDGVLQTVTGDATTTYTSVQQVVSQNINPVGRAGAFNMLLNADGTVTYSWGSTTTQIGTWSVYSKNANVIVMDIPASTFAQYSQDPILNPVYDGAKMVIALRNGHLRMGWLYPSTYAQRTYQFASSLNTQLLQGVQAATAAQ